MTPILKTILGTSASVVVGCTSNYSSSVPLTSPADLNARYGKVWSTLDYASNGAQERELVELGVPSTSSLTFWRLPAPGSRTAPSILLDGAPVQPNCLRRWDSGGHKLDEKDGSVRVFSAERIEISCLQPNSKHEVMVDGIQLTPTTAPTASDQAPFSFLAWSCNNPYSNRNKSLTFEADKVNALNLLRARSAGVIHPDGQPPQPSFAIALGDQLYVDGDNEVRAPKDALSLFVGDRSESRFLVADSDALLNTIYRYHFAIPPFDEALKAIPTAMVWDDHDIRDGWRSHGDEDQPDMLRYYGHARAAFVAYQGLRNPGVTGPNDGAMDVQFPWGGSTSTFLIDGRTNRRYAFSPASGRIISDEQFTKICAWLGERPDCGTTGFGTMTPMADDEQPHLFVLGSPSPISTNEKELGDIIKICTKTNDSVGVGEGADDVRDTWFCNPHDRHRLLVLLASHFITHPRHRLVVVSGDVHWSGVTSLEYVNGLGVKKLFGYEVISSGVTNDHTKSWFEKRGAWDGAYLVREPNSAVTSTAHGSIVGSPSFAEILVEPSERQAPQVSVIFYPSRASAYGGDTTRRGLVNYWRTLATVHKTRDFDFSSNPHLGSTDLFYTRIPLPLVAPPGLGRWLHAASVVCDAGGDSTTDATDWFDVQSGINCGAPRK